MRGTKKYDYQKASDRIMGRAGRWRQRELNLKIEEPRQFFGFFQSPQKIRQEQTPQTNVNYHLKRNTIKRATFLQLCSRIYRFELEQVFVPQHRVFFSYITAIEKYLTPNRENERGNKFDIPNLVQLIGPDLCSVSPR